MKREMLSIHVITADDGFHYWELRGPSGELVAETKDGALDRYYTWVGAFGGATAVAAHRMMEVTAMAPD